MIKHLVLNGCSYSEAYSSGNGHTDLAKMLGIESAETIALGGSANSRILRTTLKHSYNTTVPTFYLLGMTFISRQEIPICTPLNSFEGRWTNPQNQDFKNRWQFGWDESDSLTFTELRVKSEIYSILDRTEDLMYRILATIASLKQRGHRVLVFQQADNLYQGLLNDPSLALLKCPEIVNGFEWRAITWQHHLGVPPMGYGENQINHVPLEIAHRAPGEHHLLNKFLTDYIQENNILA